MALNREMSPKTKKILNIVVDVVVAIVLAFALLLAICTISSRVKGYDQYTEIFGKAYLAVSSDSMEKDKATGEVKSDNFSKGDLIAIKTISTEEAKKLKVGQVITFRTAEITNDGKYVLNTHRIDSIYNGVEGDSNAYRTKGDNNDSVDPSPVTLDQIVGVYQGKASGIGKMFLWMGTSAGFFVCVVLPTLLVVAYFAVNLVLVIMKEKKAQTAVAEQSQVDERERIRQELLAEMRANGEAPAPPAAPSDNDASAETENKSEATEPEAQDGASQTSESDNKTKE